jgi:deoxyribonuclease-1-like protein
MYKSLLICFLFIGCDGTSQDPFTSKEKPSSKGIKIMSWNIQNFGLKKASNDTIIDYLAQQMRSYDIVAIQEVSVNGGAQAVAKLDAALDRMGASWDYVVSDPTEGAGSERYAFLYKKHKVLLRGTYLEKAVKNTIDREPFVATFCIGGKREIIILSNHLVPTDKKPAIEAGHLCSLERWYKGTGFIFCGDFNLSSAHEGFSCLKKWSVPVLDGEKTSLKMKASDGKMLSQEYDNFFVSEGLNCSGGVVHFYKDFSDISLARKISDHCPIILVVY